MSLKEQTIILTDKDSQGNTIMQFPITKAKNIEDVMSIAQGGTGATSATSALSNLGILDAIINASVSGTTITFTKKDNTKFSINTQDTNNGIVAALLEQNGYVKFSNGLILQWGTNQPSPITFPVRFASKCLTVVPQLQASGDSGNMSKNRVCVTNLTARGFALEYPQSTYNYIAIGI